MVILPHHYYTGLVNKIFVYLARYLNEILKLNPLLAEKEVFTKELSDAVMKFRILYNSRNPKKRLQIKQGLENEVWAAIGEMLGAARLQQEIATLRDPVMIKLLQGTPPITIPAYSAEMATCDKRLAEIFGGAGAVAKASGHDIGGVFRGRTEIPGDTEEHLHRKMHLYGSEDGLKYTEIYMPGGGKYIGKNPNSDEDSYMFYYSKVGKTTNVTIFFSHVANFINPKIGENFPNRTKIGMIGGKGGRSGKQAPFTYVHCHLATHRGRGFTNIIVPFSEIFC